MPIPAWASGYVGLDYSSADCWALVRRVLAEQFDTFLPSSPAAAVDAYSRYSAAVEIPECGDIVLMTRIGRPHVGVMLGRDWVLHTTSTKNAVIERLSPYRHRVAGYFRIVRSPSEAQSALG